MKKALIYTEVENIGQLPSVNREGVYFVKDENNFFLPDGMAHYFPAENVKAFSTELNPTPKESQPEITQGLSPITQALDTNFILELIAVTQKPEVLVQLREQKKEQPPL